MRSVTACMIKWDIVYTSNEFGPNLLSTLVTCTFSM